jgi:iron complex outermembrane recepter protein
MKFAQLRTASHARVLIACAGALSVTPLVSAQQAPQTPQAAPPEEQLESVVVTAQKYSQELKDVPMSLSVLTGQSLEEAGQLSFTEYAQTVPSLNFATFSDGQNRINIRGMQAITGAATVAYLVDGVVQSLDTGSPDNELFDINRIEVLRGPQGTLYGAGAVGGAIKIITNQADPTQFEARASGAVEENAQHASGHDLEGMVNLPLLHDTLALRLVATQRTMDGYITVREPQFDNSAASAAFGVPLKNWSNQNIVATDANTVTVKSGRAGLTWLPTQDHDLEITAEYGEQKSDIGWAPAISPSLAPVYGTFNQIEGQNSAATSASPLDYRQGNVTVHWHLPAVNFESITGYSRLNIVNQIPSFIDVPLAPGLAVGDVLQTALTNTHRFISQELRLESATSGPLKWTAGLFYEDTRSDILEVISDGPVFSVLDPTNSFGIAQTIAAVQTSKEYAAYGQLEYAFTKQWSLILGGRDYRDDYTSEFPGTPTQSPTFTAFSPKIGVAYHYTDDVLLYSTISNGFRAGGVNIPTISPPPNGFQESFNPDKVWNYEIGVNSLLMGGRLRVDSAVFYAQWTDFQEDLLLTNSLGQQETITSNAGRAHSAGLEFEVSAVLPWHFIGKIGGAYLDAELDQDAPNPNLPGGIVPKGTTLENVPRWSGSVSLTQELPIATQVHLVDELLYTYRGQTHADILFANQTVSPAYSLLNFRVGLKSARNTWEGYLYLNNAFNKLATNFAFQNSDTEFIVPLRTFGVRLSYNFN